MIFEFEGKQINIPDKDIEKFMKKLDITKEEAIETWLEDNDYLEPDEEEQELQEKASKVKVDHGTANKKPDKPRKPRTYNASDTKKDLFEVVWQAVSGCYDTAKIEKADKLISLVIDGKNFDINVVEHRPPKK